MQKDSTTLFDKEIPRVIVLTGNDTIGREKARERMLDQLYARFDDLTEVKFDATVVPFDAYLEQIITPSLFQNNRIFHIRHAQDIPKADMEKLEPIVSSELTDVFVLIEYEKRSSKRGREKSVAQILDIKKKAKKEPEKYVFFNFEKPPDYKIAEWLTAQVPMVFHRQINKAAAEYLIDLVGNELDKLYAELQKIDIHLREKAPVDKPVIKTITGASRAMNAFELANALGQRNMPRALEIIESLYHNNVSVSSCIAVLFRHFWKLLKIRAYLNQERGVAAAYARARYFEQTKIAYDIGVATGILAATDSQKKAYPVMILSGIIDQASHFKIAFLRQIFFRLEEFDVGVKSGRVTPTKQAFEFLCYKIARVAKLQEKDAVR